MVMLTALTTAGRVDTAGSSDANASGSASVLYRTSRRTNRQPMRHRLALTVAHAVLHRSSATSVIVAAGRVDAANSRDANAVMKRRGAVSHVTPHVPTVHEAQVGVDRRTRPRCSVRVPAAYSQTLPGTLEPTRETRKRRRPWW